MPHEEKRKIIKVGNSYAVTLPKSWLRFFKLTSQDKVRMVSNSNIIIEPLKESEVSTNPLQAGANPKKKVAENGC